MKQSPEITVARNQEGGFANDFSEGPEGYMSIPRNEDGNQDKNQDIEGRPESSTR